MTSLRGEERVSACAEAPSTRFSVLSRLSLSSWGQQGLKSCVKYQKNKAGPGPGWYSLSVHAVKLLLWTLVWFRERMTTPNNS